MMHDSEEERMRKWILLSIPVIGMLFLLAGCSGCNLTTNLLNKSTGTPAEGNTSGTITAGDCVATNTDGAETVAIAGATFKMGSLPNDPGARADEQPQHDVTLSCYNIYKKEVTNAMFNKCVAAGACVPVQVRDNNPTKHVNDAAFADYPVVGVDYNMASEYCTWAGGRLPTEAEWEYAARGSDTLTYPWGNNDPTCSLANSKACLTPEDTEKVGLLLAGESPFKLMDMSGNAWEWVFDWYAKDGYSKSASTDPIGPMAGFWKVVRGGGYNSIPALLRSASRHSGDPYKPYYNVGFRCVTAPLTLPDNYTPPNPNKHELALDGPVDDDDPGNPGTQVGWDIGHVNCPDGNGNIHFAVTVIPHPFATLTSFTVDGNDFTCTWDDGSQQYQCVGPNSATADPNYNIKLCMHAESGDDGCVLGLQVPKPTNCDQGQYPQELTTSLGCPQGGFIKVSFHSDPVITWDTKESDGGLAMSCMVDAANNLVCMAQDVPPGGPYVFHLKGKDAANVPFEAWIDADPSPTCPQGTNDFKGSLIAYCNNINTPMTSMNFITDLPGDPILQVGGTDVTLHVVTPGWAAGLLDPSLQGMTVPYAMGMAPEFLSFGTIAVPDCSKEGVGFFVVRSICDQTKGPILYIQLIPANILPTKFTINGVVIPWSPDTPGGDTMTYAVPVAWWGQELTLVMTFPQSEVMHKITVPADCLPGEDKKVYVSSECEKGSPIAVISFWPPVQILQAVKFNDEPDSLASCTQVDPTIFHCPLNPAWQGTSISADVQLSGDWMSQTFPVQQCTQQTSCICRILAPECLTTTTFGFAVDTCVTNPVALVPQTVTANDGTNSYSCQFTGTLGQVYCGGSIPSSSGPLSVCFLQEGSQTQQCCTFPNFGNTIPSCANFNPNPGQPGQPGQAPCSSFTSPNTCPSNRCKWVQGPTGGGGSCQ
jgi:formylglycine-generating enzyme required for sulfatase activity